MITRSIMIIQKFCRNITYLKKIKLFKYYDEYIKLLAEYKESCYILDSMTFRLLSETIFLPQLDSNALLDQVLFGITHENSFAYFLRINKINPMIYYLVKKLAIRDSEKLDVISSSKNIFNHLILKVCHLIL